jgi:hypothetical protein
VVIVQPTFGLTEYQKQQIAKVCGVCEKDFLGNGKQKYCSRECADKKQREQLAALAEYRRKCPHCGKQIEPKSGKHKTRKARVEPTLYSWEGEGQTGLGVDS